MNGLILVEQRDLEHILENMEALKDDLLRADAMSGGWGDTPDPTKLDTSIDIVRCLLGLPDEDEYDDETEQSALELCFD